MPSVVALQGGHATSSSAVLLAVALSLIVVASEPVAATLPGLLASVATLSLSALSALLASVLSASALLALEAVALKATVVVQLLCFHFS
jgi:hypothetical protein